MFFNKSRRYTVPARKAHTFFQLVEIFKYKKNYFLILIISIKIILSKNVCAMCAIKESQNKNKIINDM